MEERRRQRTRKANTKVSALPDRNAENQDLLDLYIEELSRAPVLSAPAQKDLARRMRNTRLSPDEREEARDELIRTNLRFAFSIAKQYQNRGLDLEDLVSEANAGLVRAADKYDPDVGVNFISYAVWWVRQSLFSAIAKRGRSVRLPLNRSGDLTRVAKAQAMLREMMGREPAIEEIAQVAAIPVDVAQGLLGLLQPERSLDEPLRQRGEPGRTLGEIVSASDPEVELDRGGGLPPGLEEGSRRELLLRALEELPPRDRKVLLLYYGLDGEEPMTLEQIAQRFGVTRERIRQLRERAIRAIREGVAGELLRREWAA